MHLTVGDAALSADALGEVPDGRGLPAKHRDFKAKLALQRDGAIWREIVMVEMHMKRRHVEVMLIVMGGRGPHRQFARVAILQIEQDGWRSTPRRCWCLCAHAASQAASSLSMPRTNFRSRRLLDDDYRAYFPSPHHFAFRAKTTTSLRTRTERGAYTDRGRLPMGWVGTALPAQERS
jgi:hypothetical protein